MKTSETISPDLFDPSCALDLLTEFRKRYIPAIERGVLSGMIDRNVLDYFDRELNRMIQAFVFEALKPHRQAVSDAMAHQLPRGMMVIDKATLQEFPAIGDMEMWRGQHHGVWHRVVIKNGYRPEMQVSFNASLGEEHEIWQSDSIYAGSR